MNIETINTNSNTVESLYVAIHSDNAFLGLNELDIQRIKAKTLEDLHRFYNIVKTLCSKDLTDRDSLEGMTDVYETMDDLKWAECNGLIENVCFSSVKRNVPVTVTGSDEDEYATMVITCDYSDEDEDESATETGSDEDEYATMVITCDYSDEDEDEDESATMVITCDYEIGFTVEYSTIGQAISRYLLG